MTAVLKTKGDRFYAVINYKEGSDYKQKWISLGLPVKNNKRKAEALLADVRKKYEEMYERPAGDMLFTTYLRRWLERKKPYVELSTWEGYKIYVEKHIIPYFEPLGLSMRELKPQHIKEYYDAKYVGGRCDGKDGGLSIPSIKKHGIVLREALGEAVLEDMIARNPADGVKMPAKDTSVREKRFLTAEEANDVLMAFAGHPLEALVYTTLYYGLRRSEILGLQWNAIDFQRNTMTICHTVVKNLTVVEKDSTKTKTSFHTYDLIPDVKEVLLRQKSRQAENRKILGSAYHKSDYVFTWDDGTLFRPDYVTRGFQRVLKANGIPKMRFHDLRHSTASILYDKGWDMKDIQLWLRHSSIDVTADIYTHISENRKASMAQTLNSTFKLKEA